MFFRSEQIVFIVKVKTKYKKNTLMINELRLLRSHQIQNVEQTESTKKTET